MLFAHSGPICSPSPIARVRTDGAWYLAWQEGIDSEALAALDDAQLKELGVKRMGDRTKLRAKALGISLPAPFASPQPPRARGGDGKVQGDANEGTNIPEHLQVLKRLSGSSPEKMAAPSGPRPRVRTTVDDLAEKISATNFVLAGGPLEKYTNGGKGKPHKKFFRMLPDKKLNYDGKSVGPVLSVLNGCGPIVQEHHKVDAETAGRSFRVVCEGGVSLLLIAPSSQEKTKWMEGIEIMLIGGYKRKKEALSDPLSISAVDSVTGTASASADVAPREDQPAHAAPKTESREGVGLPDAEGADAPPAPPRKGLVGANYAETGKVRRHAPHAPAKSAAPPAAAKVQQEQRQPANQDLAEAPGLGKMPSADTDEGARRVLKVHTPAPNSDGQQPPGTEPIDALVSKTTAAPACNVDQDRSASTPIAAEASAGQQGGPPVPQQTLPSAKPAKLSVLQMASNFAQIAQDASPQQAKPGNSAAAAPTIKWRKTDGVLKVKGNTVSKSSAASVSGDEEFGVALADVALSTGVHEWEVEVGGQGLHWCGIGVASPGVGTGTSLRRAEARGKAWFYHSKGFLCEGDKFVGDWEETPHFSAGDRIGVRLDMSEGTVSFTCNEKPVAGRLEGIAPGVLPVIYMDNVPGQTASGTFVTLPRALAAPGR